MSTILLSLFLIQQNIEVFTHSFTTPTLYLLWDSNTRDASRTAVTSKMERFMITVNVWKPLTFITKRSILDVAAALHLLVNTLIQH